MLMRPSKAETAVHGCSLTGDDRVKWLCACVMRVSPCFFFFLQTTFDPELLCLRFPRDVHHCDSQLESVFHLWSLHGSVQVTLMTSFAVSHERSGGHESWCPKTNPLEIENFSYTNIISVLVKKYGH